MKAFLSFLLVLTVGALIYLLPHFVPVGMAADATTVRDTVMPLFVFFVVFLILAGAL